MFTARVLVVEDNRANQLVITLLLRRCGCTVHMAANGIEALEAVTREKFDVILMDCQMPEMDGYQATAELRSREQGNSHTPVIALTANAFIEDRDRCMAAGMDDFVTKPIDSAVLYEKLERWLPLSAIKPLPPSPGSLSPEP